MNKATEPTEASIDPATLRPQDLCARLFPITRSITGNGVRETLKIIGESVDLKTYEVPTDTPAFDWQVPREWNVREAYIVAPDGTRVVDIADNNLHLGSYSIPIHARLSREELDTHLHSLPEQPTLIPYRTLYYSENWAFCLSHEQRQSLPDGEYEVVIDATLEAGTLSYGEVFIPGSGDEELLISTHICHPSLANDNLSGISVATELARFFSNQKPGKYGLRFIFIPGTIGAITWLAQNEQRIPNIAAGLVLSGVGDSGAFTYKKSRTDNGLFDRLFTSHLASFADSEIRPYLPYGYDERQFCSPGINIAAGCLMRTPYGEYPEYHTSGDNLSLLSNERLIETILICKDVIQDAQRVRSYTNVDGRCEPQLGKRGLYEAIGGDNQGQQLQLAQLWMLSYSDGTNSTLDIHELSGISLAVLEHAAQRLLAADLLIETARP